MTEKMAGFILECTALGTFIMLLVLIYNLFRIILQKSRRIYSILIGIISFIEYCVLQFILEILNEYRIGSGVTFGKEALELLLLQLSITALAAGITKMVHKWDKKTLSKSAIKYGVDVLPAGLLFYWSSGMVKLVNVKMDSISHMLCGEGVYNGAGFWDMLVEKDMSLIPGKENDPEKNECMVRLDDGSVYSFKRNICNFEGHELYEIIATDVSEEQLLNEELKIKQIKADEIKKRLKNLNSDIEKMTVEREILETKSKVHDDLGKTLIMSRRFLENKDMKLGTEVKKLWKRNTLLLRGEEDDDKIFEYSSAIRDIGKLGLELKVEGNLPMDKDRKEIVLTALRTCATNALRHGNGTQMNVKAYDRVNYSIIEISNNGSLPEEGFSEGGGLGNLRKLTERIGGTMKVELTDVFSVKMTLPKID